MKFYIAMGVTLLGILVLTISNFINCNTIRQLKASAQADAELIAGYQQVIEDMHNTVSNLSAVVSKKWERP